MGPVPAAIKLLKVDAKRGGLASIKISVERHRPGAYTVSFPADAQPQWLVADAGDAGVGSLGWGEAVLSGQRDGAARLTVQGAGRIAGRVVDAQGHAVAGMRLCVIQAGSDQESLYRAAGYPDRYQRLIDGAGRGFVTCYTDERGEFAVGGLREDSFVITAGIALQKNLVLRRPLGRVIATASPVVVVLRLVDSEIMVRVATPTAVGGPVGGKANATGNGSSIEVEVYDLGPMGDEMVAVETRRPSWRPRARKDVVGKYSPRLVQGRYVFHVNAKAGRRYGVRASQDERSTPIRTVELDSPGQQAIVDLTIPEKPEGAKLHVDVRFASVADEHPEAVSEARVWLEDPDTGIALRADTAWARGDEGALLDAPPGPIRVVAEGAYKWTYPDRHMTSRRRHGRASAVIVVAPGADAQVEIPLPLGGAVNVTATCAGSVPGGVGSAVSFKIHLQADGSAEPEELKRLSETRDGGYRSGGYWKPGKDMISEGLPAGRYRVTVSGGPWAAAPQTIEVKSGSVVDLNLVLE